MRTSKDRPEAAAGETKARSGGLQRNTRQLSRLRKRVAGVVVENQHGALFHGQAVERRLKIQIATALCVRSDRDLAWWGEPARNHATPAAFLSDRLPHYDAVEPGGELVRFSKVLSVPPGAFERELDGILGVVTVGTDQKGDAQESLVVLSDELLESRNACCFASSKTSSLHHHTLLTRRLAESGHLSQSLPSPTSTGAQ
jgi:hypothetical protein